MTMEILYRFNSVEIAAALFLLILLCNELGFRVGRFVQEHTDTELRALTGSIQASVLGLLALMLGFTFSMAMQRYDSRNTALINEANAMGTALLRTELLPGHAATEAQDLLQRYLELRITMGRVDITRHRERQRYESEVQALQHRLWLVGVAASEESPSALTTGAFMNSLNALFDLQATRSALLQLHIPEPVLLLLFLVFISAGGMIGYSSGLGGKRIVAPMLVVSLLITLIVFIIIDLDRPRRGLIQVDNQPLVELRQASAHAPARE